MKMLTLPQHWSIQSTCLLLNTNVKRKVTLVRDRGVIRLLWKRRSTGLNGAKVCEALMMKKEARGLLWESLKREIRQKA